MDSGFIKELSKNNFLLVLLNEDEYMQNLDEIVKSVEKMHANICYVCLNKPYKHVLDELRSAGINTASFFFVDVLTSHYEKPKSSRNCVFLDSPGNLDNLRNAISGVVKEKKCSALLFDTISTLLIYQQPFSIIKFTHNIIAEESNRNVKKLFIVLKEDVSATDDTGFVKDLEMFADRKIDISA